MNVGAIKADDTRLMKDLGRFIEPVEIYDAQGKMLGLFVPANLERCKEMYAKLEAMIDWEEVRRRGDNSRPRLLHAEVLARLKALDQEMQRRKAAGEKPFTKEEAKAFVHSVCLPTT
jgi:hypothetical protein